MQSSIPAWSSNSKTLAVPVRLPGTPWQIQLFSASTTAAKETLSQLPTHCINPSWTPDGTRIFFGGIPATEIDTPVRIYSVDLKSRRVDSLEGSEGLYRPVVSPNGLQIAAINATTEEIKVQTLSSGRWTGTGVTAIYAQWSANGDGLFFLKTLNNALRVLEVLIPSMVVREKLAIQEFPHFPPWFGVVGDAQIFLPKDLTTQEIYEIKLKRSL